MIGIQLPLFAEPAAEPFDLIGNIIAWEQGDMEPDATIDFFAHLVADGTAWTLQGCYGRQADALIRAGFISKKGEVLKYVDSD